MNITHCPACGSEDIYFSKKQQQYICEDCEHRFTPDLQASAEELPAKAVRPLSLFFSYGHDANGEMVVRLKEDMEKRGHTVWIDQQEIKAGHDWRQAILDGITNSESVLAFLSRHSVRDPGVCRDELQIALCRDAVIKTVLLEDEQEVAVPASVANVQWLDMQDWKEKRKDPAWEAWYREKFTELCRVVESEESTAFAGELEEVRRVFHPSLSDTKERRLNEQPFAGRVWVHETIDKWRQYDTNSKLMAVFGGPGTGKSRYVAHALHYNPYVLCAVFCEWDRQEFNNARNIVIQLIFKLACKLSDYRKKLLDLIRQKELGGNRIDLEQLSALSVMDEFLIHPLSNTIDGGREVQVIVIDGLDEADEQGENVLVDLITRCMDNLPRWIKFLVTTRPEKSVLQVLDNFNPRKVSIESRENDRDMETYIREELTKELADHGNEQAVIDEIIRRSEGAFLYATYFIQAVRDGSVSLGDPEKYPAGLGGFYLKNFQRKFPKPVDYRMVRDYFELLAAAQNLPVEVLQKVLDSDAYDLQAFETVTGSLVKKGMQPMPGGTLKAEVLNFHHKSLADWLTGQGSGSYFVDRQSGAGKLATYAREQIGEDKVVQEDPTDGIRAYLKATMTDFYAVGQKWDELMQFLLEESTPLEPYWLAIERLPEEGSIKPLLDRLQAKLTEAMHRLEHHQGMEPVAALFHFFEQLSQERVLVMLFEALDHTDIDALLCDVRSDGVLTAGSLFDPLKLQIAYSTSLILDTCHRHGISIPTGVEQKMERLKLASLFAGGKVCGKASADVVPEDLLPLYREYGHLLNHNHCAFAGDAGEQASSGNKGRAPAEADWIHLRDLFNALCFIHEINNGIDFLNINTLRMLGVNSEAAIEAAPRFAEEVTETASGKPEKKILQLNEYDPFVVGNIARMYGSIGEYKEALTWFERLARMQEQQLGSDHLDTAATYEQMAYFHNECGTYDEGMAWYQKALDIRLQKLGAEDPGVASIYHKIGKLVGDQGREDLSAEWDLKAIRIREKVLGKEHAETGTTYNNLAYALEVLGKYEEAIAYNQLALRAFETTLRPDHPYIAMSMDNMASVYEKLGHYQDSLDLYLKGLGIRERTLGSDHPHTARTYTSLGLICRLVGDHDAALGYLEKARKVRERVFGENHPETAVVYHRMAKVWFDQRRYAEAMDLLQKVLEIRVAGLNEVNHESALTWHDIGLIHEALGEQDKALACFEKALKMREFLFADGHPAIEESRKKVHPEEL